MNDVKGVLEHLGYDELRSAGGDWRPLSEVNGQYGTTDETKIIRPDDGPIRLVDRETGDEVGFARKTEPEDQTDG